jgi:regulatory protein
MVGRRRGRSGRGWDAAPPRAGSVGPEEPDAPTRRSRSRASDRSGRGDAAASDEPTDPAERARQICLRLLAVRPRTRSELATALRRRGIDAEIAEEVLRRYGEVGMVDDEAFARAWVSSRHHGRGLARRALAVELRRRGIDADTVDRALTELDPETEIATARALVERKLRTEPPLRPSHRRRVDLDDQADHDQADHRHGDDEHTDHDSAGRDRVGRGRVDVDQADADCGDETGRWDERERRAALEALARRLVGMLARKGYPPGLAVQVVREALAEWPGARDLDSDSEWDTGLVGDDL